jgi:hypothetical protein
MEDLHFILYLVYRKIGKDRIEENTKINDNKNILTNNQIRFKLYNINLHSLMI